MESSVEIALIGAISSTVGAAISAVAVYLGNANRDHLRVVKRKIEENTEVSVKAFEEANHANNKIGDMQAALLERKTDQSDRIEATGEDTHRLVIGIKESSANG